MKHKVNIFLFSVLLFSSGCKKYVTVDPPQMLLVTKSVFNNAQTATAAQFSIYITMAGSLTSTVSVNTGLAADELKNYSTGGTNFSYYTNAVSPLGPADQWRQGYPLIYQANAIMEGLQNTEGISPAIKQQLTGEAKFIRAFWLFNIAASYGDAPLTLTTDYTVNNFLPRTPEAAVYAQVVADLKDAQNMLNSGYVDASDTAVYDIANAERVRPTKAAASALLARAYLYQKDYVNAEAQASSVINNTAMFNLEPNLKRVFLKNSREAIWQLSPSIPATSNTQEANSFILLAAPTGGKVSISNQLLGSFESNDLRKTNWIGSITTTNPVNTYYYPFKYTNRTSTITEYTMVLRLAEQYLIRAEAEANGAGGGLNAAVNDLNIIRNRAGLPNYTGTIDKPSVLAAILHERQVELFTEWGHRWYDLRRTGTIDAVMSVVTPQKGGTWSSYKALWPIQQSELTNDYNLTQNPGY